MKLYEINAELEALLEQVNEETGELTCDLELLESLMIAREEKLEGLALAVKNYDSDAAQLREEEKKLAERRKRLEANSARAKEFLRQMLNGETMKTARVVVSYRKSESVEIGSEFMEWAVQHDAYLTHKDPEPDKVMIKTALKAGETIPGATLVSKSNMQIK